MINACFVIYADGEEQSNKLRKLLDRIEIKIFINAEPQTLTVRMFMTDYHEFDPGSIGDFVRWLVELGIKNFQVKVK